jgi:hypothetical protein
MEEVVDDQAQRSQLVQNCLVMVGICTAAEMSREGRMVVLDGLRQLMTYLLAQNPEEVAVAPIYG